MMLVTAKALELESRGLSDMHKRYMHKFWSEEWLWKSCRGENIWIWVRVYCVMAMNFCQIAAWMSTEGIQLAKSLCISKTDRNNPQCPGSFRTLNQSAAKLMSLALKSMIHWFQSDSSWPASDLCCHWKSLVSLRSRHDSCKTNAWTCRIYNLQLIPWIYTVQSSSKYQKLPNHVLFPIHFLSFAQVSRGLFDQRSNQKECSST